MGIKADIGFNPMNNGRVILTRLKDLQNYGRSGKEYAEN